MARANPSSLLAALDHLADVAYFVKDSAGRFVFGNRTLLGLMGVAHMDDLLGRTDAAFSPPHLCEKYARDDREILATGRSLVDQIELVRNHDGSLDWFSTIKLPVEDGKGRRIGVYGITRVLKKQDKTAERFLRMAPAIELIMRELARPLSIEELARAVSLSASQFRRAFRQRFGVTPHRYIKQVRLNAACELLTTTDLPIADIAADSGFCDQSHLTNELVHEVGLTPRRYRRRFGRQKLPDLRRPRPVR